MSEKNPFQMVGDTCEALGNQSMLRDGGGQLVIGLVHDDARKACHWAVDEPALGIISACTAMRQESSLRLRGQALIQGYIGPAGQADRRTQSSSA